MALNWVQTTSEGDKPLPLPQEKIFQSIEGCSLSLEFSSTKDKWTAKGASFVTSQRIIFLRLPPLPSPQDPTIASPHLRSLSVPIERLLEARYMIPIFGSPYYEARVLPVRDGGLPQPAQQQGVNGNDAAGLGLLKIWFEGGGGIQFREAVEEVKARLDEQGGKLNHLEQLPSYEPPPSPSQVSHSASSSSIAPPISTSPTTRLSNLAVEDPAPSSNLTTSELPPRTRPQRSGTLPPDSTDLEAAQVARENEEMENQERLNRDAVQPPPHTEVQTASGEGAPPGYEEACER